MRLRTMTVALAATALTFAGPAAMADLVTHDPIVDTVDATGETMRLQYDTANGITGPARSTTLRIVIDGELVPPNEEHPGCNLPGDQRLKVTASLGASVVSVAFPSGDTFADCAATVPVRVTPTAVGSTGVTFSGVILKPTGSVVSTSDTKKDFDFAQAAFNVVVEEADLGDGGGTGTVCDRNPAAPAWANAILRANEVKLRGDDRRDVIRSVAREMGKAASFPDRAGNLVAKSAEAYPYVVHEYMVAEFTDLDLPHGPDDVDRPGKVCTTVTAD